MKDRLALLLIELIRLAAKLATPGLQRVFERWAAHLSPDIPALSGAWVATFRWPRAQGGSAVERLDLQLKQFGARVQGVGHIQGAPEDPILYEGIIRRNVLHGSLRRQDRRILAGVGTFILKIAADSKHMNGACAWYQSRLDEVWSSSFSWRRRGNPSN